MIELAPSLEIPFAVRQFVFDRDGWVCQNEYCINRFGNKSNLTLHHIIPRSAGGLGTNPCNLIVLCWPCHDKISLLKKNIEGCDVTDVLKLIHREQCAFYDHDFPKDYIKCSHHEVNKRSKAQEEIEVESKGTELENSC